MARKCPPGVICIENVTLIMIILISVGAVLYYSYSQKLIFSQAKDKTEVVMIQTKPPINHVNMNIRPRRLTNPYEPPLKPNFWFPSINNNSGVPINVPTRGYDSSYRQVGILTKNMGGKSIILPLMGRPLHANRNKWNYYTMSDKNNFIKLPISVKGRSCSNDYGCDEVYNGDTVYVEGYNDAYKVTIYDNDLPRYIPF